jgi:sulfonate transport system permease protein
MRKKKNKADLVITILAPLLFVILWQVACDNMWVNTRIISSPKEIVEAFLNLWRTEKFQQHFLASMKRVVVGFLFGAIAGMIFGVLTGISRKIDDIVSVPFSVLRSIPTIGLLPLLILLYGIGEKSKIIIIAIGTFWSVLLNTQQGISSTDIKLLEVSRLLEKDKLTVLLKIVFPSALPSIFTGIRLGLSGAWKSVVAAEMISSLRGIGYMISYAKEMFQVDVMFVGLITLGIVGLALDLIVLKIQKKVIYWS